MAIEKVKTQEKDLDFQISLYEINLQRAIQACIDIANVIIAKEGLGLPNTYRQAFEILAKHEVISQDLMKIMVAMVGFRNISVHDYELVDPAIVKSIVEKHLPDLEKFYSVIYKRIKS